MFLTKYTPYPPLTEWACGGRVVTTDQDTVDLITYLPKEAEMITVQKIENGIPQQISEHRMDEPIRVEKTDTGYYTIRADYSDDNSEQMTVFVCTGDDHE